MEKNKRKNYTQISNYFIDNWDELGFTVFDKTIMEKWFRGQNFYIWHDEDLGKGIGPSTVKRWREKMLTKGYCKSVDLVKEYNKETKHFYTRGYKYDFSPLVKLLNEKDMSDLADQGSIVADHRELLGTSENCSVSQNIPHTNTISQDYSQDYSSTAATTSSAKAVKEHASVPVPAVAGGVEDLYKQYLPEVKIRKSDRLSLAKLDQDKLTAYIPYLPYFDDPFWNSATSTKQPCMLPAVWQSLETFVQTFPNSAAFHTACKQLKKSGVNIDTIIENADTPAQGKQTLINMILNKGETK